MIKSSIRLVQCDQTLCFIYDFDIDAPLFVEEEVLLHWFYLTKMDVLRTMDKKSNRQSQ